MSSRGNLDHSGLRWALGTHGFALFPHSDESPNGWWFPTEDSVKRVVCPNPYTSHPLEDYQQNAYFKQKAVPEGSGAGQAVYDKNVVLDKTLHYGNQSARKDKTVFTWWGSPYGDGPLGPLFHSIRNYYVFKNGKAVWQADNPIGGLYPLSGNRFLVVEVYDEFRKAKLYDVNYSEDTKEELLLFTTTQETFPNSLVWPWRFNQSGTKCSTIFYTEHTDNDVRIKAHHLLTINITIVNDLESITYTANEEGIEDYFVIKTKIVSMSSSNSGGNFSEVSGSTSGNSTDIESLSGVHYKHPIALNYIGDELSIAYIDYSGSSLSDSFSFSGSISVGYTNNGSSSNRTITRVLKKKLVMGTFSIDLINASSVINNSTTVSGGGDWSKDLGGSDVFDEVKLLFIDIAHEVFITFGSCDLVVSMPKEYTSYPGTGGHPTHQGYSINHRRVLNLYYKEIMVNFIDDSYDKQIPSTVSNFQALPIEFIPSEVPASSSETTTETIYYERTVMFNDVSRCTYGVAVDHVGNYIFSYDSRRYLYAYIDDENGITLDEYTERITGNNSNIENFNLLVISEMESKISGSLTNPLLFPIGLV